MAHLCIAPACPGECMGCNHAISEQTAREYAIRYAWLRERHQALCTMQAAQSIGLNLSKTFVQTPAQLDEVIDAAMLPAA